MDEKIGIALEVDGYEGVMRNMRTLEGMLKGFSGRKNKIQVQADLATTRREILALKAAIDSLNKKKLEIGKGTRSGKELEGINSALEENKAKLREAQSAANQYATALRQFSQPTFKQTFSKISSSVAHVGSAMQSAGNALTKITTPFRTLMRGTLLGAGYKFFNVMSQGLSDSLSRADTFATYAKSLNALGYDANQKFTIGTGKAMTAVENLEQSVLGLPTGLDEIVASQKKYLAASGDMVTSTKAAIAANNLFLAQGSDQKDVLRGSRQLRNMLAGGKMTAQRWQSVVESMPMAIKAVGEQLGYTDKDMDKFRQSVLNGEVATKDFLNALLEVGTTGSIANAANEMKHTYSAAIANISNAFKRLGANVLDTLSGTLKGATGKDVIDYIIGLKGGIDSLSEGIQNWIKANPDTILNFLDAIKSFDWAGIARGVGSSIKNVMNLITGIARFFDGKSMDAIGKFMVYGSMLGKFLTGFGGLLKGSRHIIGGAGAGSATLGRMLFGGRQGIFSALKAKFTGKEVADVVKTATTAGTKVGGGFFSGFKSTMANIGKVAAVSLGTLGTAWASMKLIKGIVKDISEIVAVGSGVNWSAAAKIGAGVAAFVGAFTAISWAVGKMPATAFVSIGKGLVAIEGIITLITGGAWLQSAIIKRAVKNVKQITEDIAEVVGTINGMSGASISTDGVKRAFSAVYEVFSAMKSYDSLGGISKWQSSNFAKATKSLNSTIKNISSSAKTLNSFSGNVDSTSVRSAIAAIKSVYSEFDNFGTGYDVKRSEKINELVTSINNIISSLSNSSGQLQGFKAVKVNADAIKKSVEGLLDAYDTLTASFVGEKQTANGVTYRGDVDVSAMSEKAEQMSSFFSAFGSIATSISGVSVSMGELAKIDMKAFKENVNSILGQDGILASISTTWNTSKIDSKFLTGAEDVATNVASLTTFFTNLGELINAMSNVSMTFRDTSTLTQAIQPVMDALPVFVANLNRTMQSMNGLQSVDVGDKVTLAISALKQIKKLVETAKSLGTGEEAASAMTNANAMLESVLGQINVMVERISAIGTALTTNLAQGMDFSGVQNAITTGMTTAIASLNAYAPQFRASGTLLGNEVVSGLRQALAMTISIPVSVNVYLGSLSGVDAVTAAIRASFSAISVNVPVSGSAYQNGVYRQNGGAVYRASGGSIFKRRGTDTVPAMLTPGEFVQRRSAVKKFGLDFMNKINNLDVEGAMRSLAARAYTTHSVNHTINNNQRITQNVYTNSPEFASFRVGRALQRI